MRILGADLPRDSPDGEPAENTLVLLDQRGRVARAERLPSLPAVAARVSEWVQGEPFLLGVDVPVVVPGKPGRARPVENLVRRRFGARMPSGGRASLTADPRGIAGETLMAGLAAAGMPCLPYPDRDRRQPGLAETWPPLILKSLLWEGSSLAATDSEGREELFRGYALPPHRAAYARSRTGWVELVANLDLLIGALGTQDGFDLEPARAALRTVRTQREADQAAALLDAALIAGTARRYLESPETCLFLGDREHGYVILPADGFVRRLAASGTRAPRGQLFPAASLRERLGSQARLRPVDLLSVPGRRPRTEARFDDPPRYEFDNLDEMLWWKHCRHLAGPGLPTDGLCEMVVVLGAQDVADASPPLKLTRSRHRTLSFRFEPPAAWRTQVPTRDGRTYPFRVLRAVYETLPA